MRSFIARYLYRSHGFVLTWIPLAGPPAPDHLGDITFRLATAADLERLEDFEAYGHGSRQRRYVEEDRDWLFVACRGERIVATRRYSRRLPTAARDGHGLVPRVLELTPEQVWVAHAFLLPEYRNQGLNYHFGLFTMRYMTSLGYTESVGTIAPHNIVSLRTSRGRNARHGFVSYTRLLFYERLRVSETLPRRLEEALDRARGRTPRESPAPRGDRRA